MLFLDQRGSADDAVRDVHLVRHLRAGAVDRPQGLPQAAAPEHDVRDEALRTAYLDALGIDRWVAKRGGVGPRTVRRS